MSYQIKSVLHNLKASFGSPKLDTWCIMESIGLAIYIGLSGATCNGSVTPAALLGVRDDGEVGAIWSPLSGGLLCCAGTMVVALADTGLIGWRGVDADLCCCCVCCCCWDGGQRIVRSTLEDSLLLELPLSLALVFLLFAAGLLLPDDMVL